MSYLPTAEEYADTTTVEEFEDKVGRAVAKMIREGRADVPNSCLPGWVKKHLEPTQGKER